MLTLPLSTAETTPLCPKCCQPFTPRRKDQRFCTQACAKKATRNATRGTRQVANSPEARRTHNLRKGRLRGLSEALHETPPQYRAQFMLRLINEARGNAELRRLVSDRRMVRSWTRYEGTGRLHIAHILDHFCQEVYRRGSYEVLAPGAALPSADDLAFPAEYFGPDAPPIYGDGSLKKRPCPWSARKEERKSLHHYKGMDMISEKVTKLSRQSSTGTTAHEPDPRTETKKAA